MRFFISLLLMFILVQNISLGAVLHGYGDVEKCWYYSKNKWHDGVDWMANCGGNIVGGDFFCAQDKGDFADRAESLTAADMESEVYCWCRMTYPYQGDFVLVKNLTARIPQPTAYYMCNETGAGGECRTACYKLWIDDLCGDGGTYDGDCVVDFGYGLFEDSEQQEKYLSALFYKKVTQVLCSHGFSKLKTSVGTSFQLYDEKYTEPSLVVGYNDGRCYGKLAVGQSAGTINFEFNGTVYHLVD